MKFEKKLKGKFYILADFIYWSKGQEYLTILSQIF